MGLSISAKLWVNDKNDPQAKFLGPSWHSSSPRVTRSCEKRPRWYSTPESWLRGKIQDDEIDKNLWRVHDKLYDLEDFIKSHPGGSEWIQMTRGMDITELFENSHVVNVQLVELTLKTFYVKEAAHPRNSPYVFEPNGFYKTLKHRIEPILKEKGTGPTLAIRLMQDAMVGGVLLFSILGLVFDSSWSMVLAGLSLGLSSASAHNFFHIRDNWRKYYFDLSLCSHYEWRIEHVFSHHGFPNTSWDVEVLWAMPFVEFLSNRKKHWIQRFGAWIYLHLVMSLFFHLSFLCRVISIIQGEQKLRRENLLPLLHLLILMAFAPSGIMSGFIFWNILHMTCSQWVVATGLNAAHHHPICFHDGDEMRAKPDYGLCMLDATCVKVEDNDRNLFQIMTTFGEHNLHHLFPAICISKIGHIKAIVEQTVKDFEEELIFLTQWQLFKGMHDQMARVKPHSFQYDIGERRKTQVQAVWSTKTL